jgi:uncharacterized repeat protein (TIGR01451 family)
VTFRITVVNTGTETVTDLAVVDTVSPLVVNQVAVSPPGWAPPVVTDTGSGTRYEWSRTGLVLPPGASTTFTISGDTGVVCAAQDLPNSALVAAASAGGATAFVVAAPGASLLPATLAFTAVKQVTAGSGTAPGDPAGFRLVVANTGAATITALTVVDTVPSVVTGVSAAQPAAFGAPVVTSVAGGTRYVWSAVTPLAPGATFTFTVTGTVGAVGGPVPVGNTGFVVAGDDCAEVRGFTNVAGFVAAPPPGPPPVLAAAVAKTLTPAAPVVGGPVTYTIAVTNTGTDTITDLLVVDTVAPVVIGAVPASPAGWALPVVSSVAGGTRYAWSAAGLVLSPGTTTTFTISGRAGLVCVPTGLLNTALVAAGNAGGTTRLLASAPGAVLVPPVTALTIVKTQVPAAPARGAPVTYQIVVTNTGEATIESLIVVDTVAGTVTGVVPTTPAGFAAQPVVQTPSGTVFSWASTAPVPPGMAATFRLDGVVGVTFANLGVSNTAYALASSGCSTTSLVSNATGFGTVALVMSVSAVKEIEPAVPVVGGPVTYRLVVTNTGTATIPSLVVTDTVSAVATAISTAAPAGFAAPTVTNLASGTWYSWSGGPLVPGAVFTFTITGIVGAVTVPTAVSNTAYVTYPTSAKTEQAAATNVVGFVVAPTAPEAVLVATLAAPASDYVGNVFTVILTVSNTGTGAAAGVVPSLTVPTAGLGGFGSGPLPAAPVTIPAGGSASFTWTWGSGRAGWVEFDAGAGGTDIVTGLPVAAPIATRTVSVTQTPTGTVIILGGPKAPINPTLGETVRITVWPSTAGIVEVRLYDMRGRLVLTLTAVSGGGGVTLVWDGRDDRRNLVPPGAYPIRILAPGITKTATLGVLY